MWTLSELELLHRQNVFSCHALSHEMCLSDKFGAIKRKFVCKTANKHKSKTMLKSSQNRFISKAIIFRCVIIYGRNFFFCFPFSFVPPHDCVRSKIHEYLRAALDIFPLICDKYQSFSVFLAPSPFLLPPLIVVCWNVVCAWKILWAK